MTYACKTCEIRKSQEGNIFVNHKILGASGIANLTITEHFAKKNLKLPGKQPKDRSPPKSLLKNGFPLNVGINSQ